MGGTSGNTRFYAIDTNTDSLIVGGDTDDASIHKWALGVSYPLAVYMDLKYKHVRWAKTYQNSNYYIKKI